MFEDRTYENIKTEMLAEFPPDIDIREGSVAYDSVSAFAAKIAMLYIDIANCYELTNLEKSSGEYLDRFASEHGLKRIASSQAVYEFLFEGTKPNDGTEFYDESGDNYFTLVTTSDGILTLVSEESGTTQNTVLSGTPAIPVDNIEGLLSATFGELLIPAIDEESDEALRGRIKDKISGPAENANRSQYQSWCESVEGVGRAIIHPLAYGPNTVMAILISPEGLPAVDSIVKNVQEYIDPMKPAFVITYHDEKITMGSGCGDGVAPIGAHFVAMAAKNYDVRVTLKVELKNGYKIEDAKIAINKAITSYFKNLALEAEDSNVIRYTKIASIIEQLDEVLDYCNLTINNGTENIIIPKNAVAVLKEVNADVVV